MTVTNSELVIYSTQRIPGFEKVRDMAAELLEARKRLDALVALLDVDRLEEIITDSIDLDWTPRTAAKAIVRAIGGDGT